MRRALPLLLALCCATPGFCARPGPFRFCYGLSHPADLPVLKQLGLDTVYLQLDPAAAVNAASIRALIGRAHEQGLKVILELPTCLTARYRVSPCDARYAGSMSELVQSLVSQLKDEPGLTAWATQSMLERRLDFTDEDFRVYLEGVYRDLESLNAHWGARFPTWLSVNLKQASELEAAAPYKVGPAAVAVADYKAWAYRHVMELWLQAIRRADATRPVLTGRVTLYRSLLSIPAGYDVVCVSMPPDVLENDLLAHNPQALDIARRGGTFDVLPVFRVPDNTSPAYASEGLRAWTHYAALHGAIGFGLEDWDLLAPIYELEHGGLEGGRRLIHAIQGAAQVPCTLTPRPTAAILYSPYASGFDVTRQPVYGYLVDYLVGEPSNLAYDLRMGTRYGLVDYLSVEDLQSRELAQYGCVLAPACLNLPAPQAGQLEEFVRGGGAFVADLGLGAYQSGSWAQMAPVLQEAFGLAGLTAPRERVGDLIAAEGLPALQPWPRGTKARGEFSSRRASTAPATESRTYPVSGWVAEAVLGPNAAPIATIAVRFDEQKRPLFSGLIGRQHGSGVALFATHPLWQYWPLADGLSQALHGHLLGRRADWELVQPGLLPTEMAFGAGDGGAAIYNPGRLAALAQLWSYGARSHAYSHSACQFTAAPGQQGLRPGTVLLVASVPPAETLHLDKLPLIVQPAAGEATLLVREVGPQQVLLEIAGTGAVVRHSPRGLQMGGGEEANVRMILGHGTYAVAPGSQHVVTVKARTRTARTVVTANGKGELDLSGTYRAGTITIAPQ